ncbi:MAG: hypothetical protein ACR2RB_20305 [Gammaproteobacteria bacterium]
MKTIKDVLKQTKPHPDNTKVTLQLHVPLKKVRAYAKRFASLGVVNVTIAGGAKAAVKKAKPKTRSKKAVKKATTKKPAKAKRATKKAPVKRGNTAGVTQAAVLAAIRGKYRTPQAIATAMKANPVQVRKALSRYTKQGLIVRTGLGQYALKT